MKNDLPTNWSYAEFHAFVMFYAANADNHITTEEISPYFDRRTIQYGGIGV